jgi:hypothetical protein
MITGPAAQWLQGRREELNQKFEQARRRHPLLAPAGMLTALESILPPLAGGEGDDALLSAVYDLVLLHVARDAFAAQPGLGVLLRDAFPRLRSLLVQRPSFLPAALSNAVEHMGPRGEDLARGLATVGPRLSSAQQLTDAGALLAWRLGETRVRDAALAAVDSLPPRAVLDALDLADWPDAAAPLAVTGLRTDAWCAPREAVSAETAKRVATGAPLEPLLASLRSPRAPLAAWRLVGRVGDFSGFGGAFDVPPVVLDGGDRHHFHLRCDDAFFLVEADCFGWRCQLEPDPSLPIRTPVGGGKARKLVARIQANGTSLRVDGTLTIRKEEARFDALAGTSAFTVVPAAVVATHPDSHRLRVVAARGELL